MKKGIKGFIVGVITTLTLLTAVFATCAEPIYKTITVAYNNIKIYVNDSLIVPKDPNGNIVEPFIYNGTTYLPVRAVSEALVQKVEWDGKTNSIYIGERKVTNNETNNETNEQTNDRPSGLGNTSGNLANNGYACLKDGWIYYRNSGDGNKLYKVKTDGTGKTKISDDSPIFINVVSDWIYYSNDNDDGKIYKIRTDGTERTKLNNESSGNILVKDGWIYYSEVIGPREYAATLYNCWDIYRMKCDGTSISTISKNKYAPAFVNVVDDWIYFASFYDGKIYTMKTDGTNETTLNNCRVAQSIIVDNEIYYSNVYENGTVYKMNLNGTGNTKLDYNFKVNTFNISDGWIYFSNMEDNDKLYKIKTVGTGKTKLSDIPAYEINIVGDWIYYHDKTDKVFTLYKVKKDGTGKGLVN